MLTTLFPAYLFHKNLLDEVDPRRGITEDYLKDLKKTMSQMRSDDPTGRKISNAYTGWQSNDGCESHPVFAPLIRKIKQYVEDEVLPFYKLSAGDLQLTVGNMWGNINDHMAWNRPHEHNGCWYSGIFYIDCPSNESGVTTFFEHGARVLDAMPPTRRGASSFSVPPTNGNLVLFPSGLSHMVDPNLTHTDRYTVAFNLQTHWLSSFGKEYGSDKDFSFSFDIDENGEPHPVTGRQLGLF